MRWPWQREKKSAVLGQNDVLSKLLGFARGGANSPADALDLYEQSSAVYVPINWIADCFEVLEPALVDKRDGAIDKEHDILDFLARPSPYFSGELFRSCIAHDYLATGETYAVALGSQGSPPVEMQPISPKYSTPLADSMGYPALIEVTGSTLAGRYNRLDMTKRRVKFLHSDDREIKQIRNYSTKDNSLLRGQSPLIAASSEANQHIAGAVHNLSILKRGGTASLGFHFEEDLNEDEFAEAKKMVDAIYSGEKNAGRIIVTAGEKLKIQDFQSVSNRDMDFAVLNEMAQQAVAKTYKVPLPLLTTDASTFNNFQAALLALYDYAVIPLAKCLFGGLDDMLLERFNLDGRNVGLGIDPSSITALEERMIELVLKRSQTGVETDNELRYGLGREPIENGDVVWKPSTMVPAGSDLFTEDNVPFRDVNANEDDDEEAA